MKTLIIGYGNRSRRDDSVGWVVLERLQAVGLPDVELCTAHQLDVDFAETIRQFDRVIFVDAAVPSTPALITRTALQPAWQSHAVAHFLTAGDLLHLCATLYGEEPVGILFSIRGEDFNFGTTLSPAVDRAADEVVRQIQELIGTVPAQDVEIPISTS